MLSTRQPGRASTGGRRRGITLIETQIAFVVLGIGLAGICPIVAMHYRQLSNLEGNVHAPDQQHAAAYVSPRTANGQRGRLQAYSYIYGNINAARNQASPGQMHYIVPWSNPWARKLATRAQVLPAPWSPGGPLDPSVTTPNQYSVTLKTLERVSGANGKTTGWRAVVDLK